MLKQGRINIADIKTGDKVVIREDLQIGDTYYDSRNEDTMYVVFKDHHAQYRGKAVTVSIVDEDDSSFTIEESAKAVWFSSVMIRCKAEENKEINSFAEFVTETNSVVTGYITMVLMEQGKFLEREGIEQEHYYYLDGNSIICHASNGNKFTVGKTVQEFVKHNYKVLNDIPEWAVPNPFEVGDVVVPTGEGDGGMEYAEEITEIVDNKQFRGIFDNGNRSSNRSVGRYRLATEEEKLSFYKELAHNLLDQLEEYDD